MPEHGLSVFALGKGQDVAAQLLCLPTSCAPTVAWSCSRHQPIAGKQHQPRAPGQQPVMQLNSCCVLSSGLTRFTELQDMVCKGTLHVCWRVQFRVLLDAQRNSAT